MRGSPPAVFLPAVAASCALSLLVAAAPLRAQVFTVEAEHVEKHYTEFPPTHVRYSSEPMTTVGREILIRFMQSEQGFAMRPLPIANLNLHANGHMDPTGDKYVDVLHMKGTSVKPGERVVVTDIKILNDKIILDLNGGPEHKHKYLRHISIGMGAAETPLAQDSGAPPTGSRVTLVFEERVPDLNGEQLEALLKPMIDFGVKSQGEAYAESLPDFLRKAVQEHRVLVGMNREMVLNAKGQPLRKIREAEPNGKQFETWIYGESPQPVEFVRFEGSYVTRVQLAKVGEPMEERSENEMGDYWGNQPAMASNQHEVKLGDRTNKEVDDESAPKAPPTLRKPGEPVPTDKDNPQPVMAPVNFPKDQQRPGDPGYTPTVSAQQPTQGSGTAGASPAASGQSQGQAQPPSGAGQNSPSSGTSQSQPSQPSPSQQGNPPSNQQ